jgi:protoporphyrinogen oxidase
MLGMTLAHRLAQAGRRVSLFEASGEWGGLAGCWQIGGVVWDRHYHVILSSDGHLRRLLAELGLERDIRWVETRTGFYTDGRFYSMSDVPEFLRFPPLSLLNRLRLGATVFYASRVRNWRKLERIPVCGWLEKWSGRRACEKIWFPLLRAKLGENYRKASAAFIWTHIARMYAARRAGLKKELLGYVPGGYRSILARFTEVLEGEGVRLKLGHEAKRVGPVPEGRLAVEFAHAHCETFDHVILTVPSPVAASLCPALPDAEKARLNGIEYQGIVCASVLLRKPLMGFYVTNLTDSRAPFTGVIEMSALVGSEYFGGNTLVYLPRYVPSGDAVFRCSDAELRDEFVGALKRMYPALEAEDVVCFQVSRVPRVFPIPTVNYSERLPGMETSIPGLHIVNSSQILNGTLNVNETIEQAERYAESIAG